MNSQKVQVLMSTYNGEKYLKTQLESILAQTWKNLEVIIRDDGSKDGTVELIKEMCTEYANIHLIEGENVGSNKSFFDLLAESDADYVAFSDQDDFWLPNKIEEAVKCLTSQDEYLLYCSNKILVDKDLVELPNFKLEQLYPSFENAVVENICTGCTIVMKKKMTDIIKSNIPQNAVYHDWWCYMVAEYYGKVYFDKNAYIKYRQHELNQVGAESGLIGQIKNKKKAIDKNEGKLKKQLVEFANIYQGKSDKDSLVRVISTADTSLKSRMKCVWGNSYKRQLNMDKWVVRMLFLIGKMV